MSEIYLIDKFSSLESKIHKLSTFSKIIFIALLVILNLFTSSLLKLAMIFFLILALIRAAKLPLRTLLKISLYPLFFALIFALSQIGYGILPLISLLRAWNISLLILFLFSTTNYLKIFSLIGKISSTLSTLLFLTYRFFFLLLEEIENRIKAAKCRNAFISFSKSIKNAGLIASQILISSIEKSEKMYKALLVKGFTGRIKLAEREEFKLKDLLFILFGIIIFVILWK